MATNDLVGSSHATVRDDCEVVVERAVGALDGKVALVRAHRVLENLARHPQELLVKGAEQRIRRLGQVDDLSEHVLGEQHRTVSRRSMACGLHDHLTPLGLVNNDVVGRQKLRVLAQRSHLDGTARQEAVAVGNRTGHYVAELNGDDLRAK